MKKFVTSFLLIVSVLVSLFSPIGSRVQAQNIDTLISDVKVTRVTSNTVTISVTTQRIPTTLEASVLEGLSTSAVTVVTNPLNRTQGTQESVLSGLKANTPYTLQIKVTETIERAPLPGEIVLQGQTGITETRTYYHEGRIQTVATGGEPLVNPNITFTKGATPNLTGSLNSGAVTESTGTTAGATVFNSPSTEPLPPCYGGGLDFDLGGCIVRALYYGLYVPTSWLFAAGAWFFDSVFEHSIASESYRSSFITEGWTLIRDISNIFFIFILLYIAIGTILDIKGVEWKRMIANVVLIGVAINFSLFFTRLVIDVSNITARVFHQSDVITINKGGEPASISEAIVDAADPQNLTIQSSKIDNLGTNQQVPQETVPRTTLGFIIIILVAVAVNIYGAWIFIGVAGAFIGRIIGLWISLLFSPFAFITYAVPPSFNFGGDFKFNKWWQNLWELSIMAPIFMFFLYLILLFIQTGFDSIFKTTSTTGGIQWILGIIIPFAIILGLFKKAKDIAVSLSGEAGKMISGWTSKLGALAVGGAAGLAVGGVSTVIARGGQRTIGKAFGKLGDADWVQNMKSNNNWVTRNTGSVLEKIGKKASEASFDPRKVGIVQSGINQVQQSTGMKIGSTMALDRMNMGEKDTKGGYDQNIKDKTKRKQEFMNGIKTNATQKDIDDNKHKYQDYETSQQFIDKKAYYQSLGYSDAGAHEQVTKEFAQFNEHAAYSIQLAQYVQQKQATNPSISTQDAEKEFKEKNKAPATIRTPKDLEKYRKEKVRQRYEREGKNEILKAGWSTEAKSSEKAAKVKPTELDKINKRLEEIGEIDEKEVDTKIKDHLSKITTAENKVKEIEEEIKRKSSTAYGSTGLTDAEKEAFNLQITEQKFAITKLKKELKKLENISEEKENFEKRKADLEEKEKNKDKEGKK